MSEESAASESKVKSFLFTHAVTTFKKNKALRVWLETFLKYHNPEMLGHLVIADDNDGEAREVYDEFKERFNDKLFYVTGRRSGIARNKNRCIRFFLEETKDDGLLLWDDDIQFVGPGIEKQCLKPEWGHHCGYLGDPQYPNQWDITLPFFIDFRPQASTEYLWYCLGSQGVMMFMVRQVVDPAIGGVGYFDTDWKGMYGFEHSIYSNRINKKHSFFPEWYAVLQGCERFFITQEVPNDYEPDYIRDKAGKLVIDDKGRPKLVNEEQWLKRREEIKQGWGLVKKDHGL